MLIEVLNEYYEITIMNVLNKEDATALKSAITQIYPTIAIYILSFSLVLSAYVDEGTIAMTWVRIIDDGEINY